MVVTNDERWHHVGADLHMADRATRIALAWFRDGSKAEIEPDGSPVTRVDCAIAVTMADLIV